MTRSARSADEISNGRYYFYLALRWFIALLMFLYSAAKFFHTQFVAEPDVLDRPIGELSGFELTWVYYGYSEFYGYLIAGSQALAGLLILFRPTLRVGVLLFLGVMSNIVMINVFYGIGQGADWWQSPILTSFALLFAGLILLAADLPDFSSYLFGESRATANRATGKLHWVKYPIIFAVFAGVFFGIYQVKQTAMAESPLSGTWEFADGADQQRIYFNSDSNCVILNNEDKRLYGKCEVDDEAKTIDAKFFVETVDGEDQFLELSGDYQRSGDKLAWNLSEGPIELTKVDYLYGHPWRKE